MCRRVMSRAVFAVLLGISVLVVNATCAKADDPPPVLTDATVFFFTTDDNKDHDTLLTVTFFENSGVIAARISGYFGEFPDWSWSEHFHLTILDANATVADLVGGMTHVRIDPNGHDRWNWDYFYFLTFSDGSVLSGSYYDHWLSESNRVNCFTIGR